MIHTILNHATNRPNRYIFTSVATKRALEMRIRFGAMILSFACTGHAFCQDTPATTGAAQDRYKYTPTVWGHLPASAGPKASEYKAVGARTAPISKDPSADLTSVAPQALTIASYFRPAPPIPMHRRQAGVFVEQVSSQGANARFKTFGDPDSVSSAMSLVTKVEAAPRVRISRSCASLAGGSHAYKATSVTLGTEPPVRLSSTDR